MFAKRGKDKTMQEQTEDEREKSRVSQPGEKVFTYMCRRLPSAAYRSAAAKENNKRKRERKKKKKIQRKRGDSSKTKQNEKRKERKKCFSFYLRVKLNLSLDGWYVFCFFCFLNTASSVVATDECSCVSDMFTFSRHFWYFTALRGRVCLRF